MQQALYIRYQGHRKICCIYDVVDMVVFVWCLEEGVLYRLYGRMMDGFAFMMVDQFMAAIANGRRYLLGSCQDISYEICNLC